MAGSSHWPARGGSLGRPAPLGPSRCRCASRVSPPSSTSSACAPARAPLAQVVRAMPPAPSVHRAAAPRSRPAPRRRGSPAPARSPKNHEALGTGRRSPHPGPRAPEGYVLPDLICSSGSLRSTAGGVPAGTGRRHCARCRRSAPTSRTMSGCTTSARRSGAAAASRTEGALAGKEPSRSPPAPSPGGSLGDSPGPAHDPAAVGSRSPHSCLTIRDRPDSRFSAATRSSVEVKKAYADGHPRVTCERPRGAKALGEGGAM